MNKEELIREIERLEGEAVKLDLLIKYNECLYLIEKYKEDNEELRKFCGIYLDRAEKAEALLCNGCERI